MYENAAALAQRPRAVPKIRHSNLELFRIVTMLLIIASHYVSNSGLIDPGGPVFAQPLDPRSLFLLIFGAFGKTGINCFVLITGYFMCTSHITARKFCKLLGEVMLYRLLLLPFWITGYEPFTFGALIQALLPVTEIGTEFVQCYLLFYLCIPFLNILLHHLNETQHLRLIALGSLIYVLFGTLRRVQMNYISWFIVLYFIAAYLRLYPRPIQCKTALWGWLTLAAFAVSALSVVLWTWIGVEQQKNNAIFSYMLLYDSNAILAAAAAVFAFLFFKSLRIRPHLWINEIAATTFGVLLIHANSDAMRRWLWQDVLDVVGAYGSPRFVLHAFLSVLVVFLVCALVDMLRIRFLEPPFLRGVDRMLKRSRSTEKV